MKKFFQLLLPITIFAVRVSFLPISCPAQSHYHFFYGKVITAENRQPLSNVNLSFVGSDMGTVSGKDGSFSFYMDKLPIIMVVSHIGYKTRKIMLNERSDELVLVMEKAVHELKEVEITANKIVPFFKSERYTIRDYEIDSGMVYLLVFRNRVSKEELICKNTDGDTVARSGVLGFTPLTLLKDCLGYLHIYGEDSVYQVYRSGRELQMIYPVTTGLFSSFLGNCVTSTEKALYFRKMFAASQGVIYYGVDKTSRVKKVLATVKDRYRLNLLRNNFMDAIFLSKTSAGGDAWDLSKESEDLVSLSEMRGKFDEWNWVHKVVYRPMKTALLKVGDELCVFDIPGKAVEFYDMDGNFRLQLVLNVDGVSGNKWSGDILQDEAKSKVYTTFLEGEVSMLYRIDMNSGDLHRILAIQHPFPEKIKVYNDQLYYLYNVMGDPDNKTLYRQNLY